MKIVIYLLVASIVIMAMIAGFILLNILIEIYTLGNRVGDNLVASGWAGFKCVDLDKLARRKNISNEENRDVSLDKEKARLLVTEYIKENLNLDALLYPKEESYIRCKTYPVIIKEIEVYNAEELPAVCSKGISFERTTIHIIVSIPADIKFIGFKYLERHVDVDTKSFYNN